ncbi:alpha-L-rhamnosidase N-terminal domain-containing protein [Streptomyces sp. FXJ1.4098]|nr:alpha-L-rhamnosidase N-terminal domain-containing protein [Streptomyces sp. FXJ1.4098]
MYEAELNGVRIGDHVLAPGWTSYAHRLRYQTFDVTDLLREGANAVGALVGEGWYAGRIGFNGGRRAIWGEQTSLLAQLEIAYADGTRETVATDPDWRAATGPVLRSEIYDGEVYDARLERDGWSRPGHDTTGWSPVEQTDPPAGELVAPTGRRSAASRPWRRPR